MPDVSAALVHERAGAATLGSLSALLDVRQMGEVDRLTIAAGTSGILLMETAGASVACCVMVAILPFFTS